ncbi:hypothetical protein TPHA_0J01970 [Tetrapisispora phaffii CBS 4417]|uniref:CUE domain-containing protein n=1 Tax=Tetrapisispora phaffii (strain ATCC 24235 / CBS 4417 / NBRC 1672 / NRRL Y-8282 / UCD 70-5) TaxID=1071381 RepID=G8BYS6_TETPH|nr:hypothetical protein TPHA_0J01970 [Tetrapisispora phaffii CBS 4417]CCE65018.1 hypothetical protein TPHA_0J01970 [Tetrapisispora phaffii CBS 4417]
MSKVLEIEGNITQIDVPIVKFPPIALRALLVEKDPVVWAHILETYVVYFEYLMQQDNITYLSSSTYDNLILFLRGYLSEMAADKGRILSLGENQEVSAALNYLRMWVFALIKRCGPIYFQLNGDSLWDIVKIYGEEHGDVVKGLIDGTVEPQINTQRAQINKSHQIQQHIRRLVDEAKFTRIDLKALEYLLSRDSNGSKDFADRFISTSWLEFLEKEWNKGKGRLSQLAKQMAIITLLSCSFESIARVLKELEIINLENLSMYPLIGSLLINENFQNRIPGIKTRLLFLNIDSDENEEGTSIEHDLYPAVSEEVIATLSELFPHLTKYQFVNLLARYDNNVELVTDILFQNPSIVDDIPPHPVDERNKEKKTAKSKGKSENNKAKLQNDSNIIYPVARKRNKKINISSDHIPDAVKNKTLSRALELLYEDDEDEEDDTYEDLEVERSANHGRVAIDKDNIKKNITGNAETSKYDHIEGYLWNLLKEDKSLFERNKRGSKIRKSMKSDTTWSDEQIEGWARMIERSPKRAMILEEKFMFKGNKRSGKVSFIQNRHDKLVNEQLAKAEAQEQKTQQNASNKTTTEKQPTKFNSPTAKKNSIIETKRIKARMPTITERQVTIRN